MTTDAPSIPAMPPDPGLPGVRGLFRDGGAGVLAPFLDARGWSLVGWRPVQATYHPERSCVVRYRVRAVSENGDPRVLTLAAEARHRPGRATDPPETFAGRFGLADPVERIGPHLVWAYPYDPSLEGLPAAAWGPVVRERLEAAGVPLRAVSVQPLRYRPRRRAVFRYTGLHGGRTAGAPEALYGKVLRRSKLERWARLPAPGRRGLRFAAPLATIDGGPLVFGELRGRSLRDLLLSGASLPAPERVAALLEEVPRTFPLPPEERDRDKPLRTSVATADMIGRLVPEAGPAAARVNEAVIQGVAGDAVPTTMVHGDLYEAQVFVGEDYSLGLIDLDDAGPGDPAMDAANFCAHLIALALAIPRARRRLMAYRALVRPAFLARLGIGRPQLAWREALCMLTLATGPFRVLEPDWPAKVGRWTDVALRLADSP
jgi:hypothetical protein